MKTKILIILLVCLIPLVVLAKEYEAPCTLAVVRTWMFNKFIYPLREVKPLEWSTASKSDEGYKVRCKFEAPNPTNPTNSVKIVYNWMFYMEESGVISNGLYEITIYEIISVTDLLGNTIWPFETTRSLTPAERESLMIFKDFEDYFGNGNETGETE